MKKLALVGAIVFDLVSVSARADAEMIGTLETRELDISSDTVQAEDVMVAPRGTLNKGGTGKWTLPTDKVPQSWTMPLGVRKGELVLKASADSAVDADATAILQKAKVWLEADANVVSGDDGVTEWRDVRETGDGSAEKPYQYVRAVADTTWGAKPVAMTQEGNPTVYFNEEYSGSWMDLRGTDGSAVRISDLQHVFFVEASYHMTGTFLGTRSGNPTFQCGRNTVPTARIWEPAAPENYHHHAARTYLNGAEVDALMSVGLPVGFCLVDERFMGALPYVDCLMNDRNLFGGTTEGSNKQRQGGEHLSAVVLFDTVLTEAERMTLERYFLRKYGLETPASFAVRTAKGTKVTIDETEEEAAPVSYSFVGEGALGYVGDNDRELASRDVETADLNGWVDYGNGAVTARWSPPMAVTAGTKMTADAPAYGGVTTYRTEAAEADTVEKTGAGEWLVRSVADDVKTFDVKEGLASFSAVRQSADSLEANRFEPAYGTLENPSLEMVDSGHVNVGVVTVLGADGGVQDKQQNGSYHGWHARVEAGCQGEVKIINVAQPSSYRDSWAWPQVAVDGTRYIETKRDGDIWTTFTVGKTAHYSVRFRVAPRKSYARNKQISVRVGPTEDSLAEIGQFVIPDTDNNVYTTFSFEIGNLTAGDERQLWLVTPHDKADTACGYDLFEIVESVPSTVPNGDFELTKPGFVLKADTYNLTPDQMNADKVAGWTVTQSSTVDEGSTKVYSGFTTPAFYNGWFFNAAWSAGGNVQLYLSSPGATAGTTFTPAAGVWRVSAKSALTLFNNGSSYRSRLRAQVVIGGETVDLGVLTLADMQLQDRVWPMAFEVDGQTEVTLKIVLVDSAGATGNPHAIVDDVKLVNAASCLSEELIRNGGFEKDSDWTYFSDDPDKKGYNTVRANAATCNPASSWGFHLCFGDYVLLLRRRGGASQKVTLDQPGLYRLRLYSQMRTWGWGVPSSYLEPVKVCLAQGGVTNECCRFEANVTNYTEVVRTFRVDKAGDYDFILQGDTSAPSDQCMYVDGVSLQRVALASETPNLPEAMTLSVAEGAKINLDFTGTNRLERVRLGGRTRTGVISAETYPDYVTGPGALLPAEHGMMLLVR